VFKTFEVKRRLEAQIAIKLMCLKMYGAKLVSPVWKIPFARVLKTNGKMILLL
jgi:hypothetical protein